MEPQPRKTSVSTAHLQPGVLSGPRAQGIRDSAPSSPPEMKHFAGIFVQLKGSPEPGPTPWSKATNWD